MAPSTQAKKRYQPPALTSVRVFLPMLTATTGGSHPRAKRRLPFGPP